MQKAEDGKVWGDVFKFDMAYLHKLATRIESMRLAKDEIDVELNWARTEETRAERAQELRALAP